MMKNPSPQPSPHGGEGARVVAVLFVIVFAAAAPSATLACSFCGTASTRTMLTDLDAADIAFIAELGQPTPVRSNPTAFDLLNMDRQKGNAGFTIRNALRGGPDHQPGVAITVPLRVPDACGTQHLLTYNRSEDRWASYRLSPDGARFSVGAAAMPKDDPKGRSQSVTARRLEFCLGFLGTDDFLLRKAVFAEFAKAPYSSIQQLRPKLKRELIHQWMLSASKRAEEARQVFILLSAGGDQSDVPMLRREFAQCVESNWAGTLDGVVLAYVALGGVDALDDIDHHLLASQECPIALKAAAANALRFLVDHQCGVPRPRLLQSCRLLLHTPETAELIVNDFARWEDWPWRK